jgi:hypothetical protein
VPDPELEPDPELDPEPELPLDPLDEPDPVTCRITRFEEDWFEKVATST